MKQYVVDQLGPGDYEKIKDYLDERYGPCRVEGIYWVPLDPGAVTRIQSEHVRCQPHVFAVHLEPETLTCELLVRTLSHINCDCTAYAGEAQLLSIVSWVDEILRELGVSF